MTTLTKDNIYKGMEVDDVEVLKSIPDIDVTLGVDTNQMWGIVMGIDGLTEEDAVNILQLGLPIIRINNKGKAKVEV